MSAMQHLDIGWKSLLSTVYCSLKFSHVFLSFASVFFFKALSFYIFLTTICISLKLGNGR